MVTTKKDAAQPGRATGLKKQKQSPPKTPPRGVLFFSLRKQSANPDASPSNKELKRNQSLPHRSRATSPTKAAKKAGEPSLPHRSRATSPTKGATKAGKPSLPHRSRATSPTKASKKAQGKQKTVISPKPKKIKAARGSPFGTIGSSSSSSESSFSDEGVVPLPSPRRGANKKSSNVASPVAASPSRTPTHGSRRVHFKIEAITTSSHPVKEEGTKKKANKAKADAQEKTRTVREAPANTKRLKHAKLEAVLEEKAIDDATNDTEAALASRDNEPLTMKFVEERLAKQQKEHEKAMAALEKKLRKKLRKKEHDDNEAVLEEKAIDDAANDTEAALASRDNESLTMKFVEERLAKQQKEHEKAMAALEKKLRKKAHDDNNDSKPDVEDRVSETEATQVEEPEEASPTKTFTSSTNNEDCRDDDGINIDDRGIEGSKETDLHNIVTALQTEREKAIQARGQLRQALAELDVVKSDFRDAKGAYASENFHLQNRLTRMTDRIEELEHEMAMYGKSFACASLEEELEYNSIASPSSDGGERGEEVNDSICSCNLVPKEFLKAAFVHENKWHYM